MKCNKKIFYRCLRVFPIIIIPSLLLCGCPSGNTSQNGFMSHNTITEGDLLELNYPDGVAEPEDYMGNANANDGDETADVVRNDEGAQNMVRTDTWAATAHLSDKKAMELTLPARDGEPVKISFTDNNEQGKSDGGKGGVDVS